MISQVISGLLPIRFILLAIGTYRENGFANFIYSITEQLVRQFYGLFNNKIIYDNGRRLEHETVIALIVYSLVTLPATEANSTLVVYFAIMFLGLYTVVLL